MGTTSYKKAKRIRIAERDLHLDLDENTWPQTVPAGWEKDGSSLVRTIRKNESDAPAIPTAMQEAILRFPSAPVHGLQRLHEHHVTLGAPENFHTYRLLRSDN
jgi:hypothetical protein